MYLCKMLATSPFPNKFPRIAADVLMGLTFASFGSMARGPEVVEDLRFLAIFVVGVHVGSLNIFSAGFMILSNP